MKNLSIKTLDGTQDIHIIVKGDLSAIDAMSFKKHSQRLISESDKNMTIDLSDVTNFDIAGLNAILQAHRNLKLKGSELKVISMRNETVAELFYLTQFDKYLSIIPAA